MNNIGSKIISNYDYSNLTKPTYPFPKPSITQRQYDPPSNYFSYPLQPPHPMFSPPVYNNSYMNQTRKKMYNSLLRDKIDDLEDALLERQTMKKERTLLQVQSLGLLSRSSLKDETSLEMLKIMSRQQDIFGDLARTINTLGEKVNFPPHSTEYGTAVPKNLELNKNLNNGSVKSREEILKELDIESDDSQEIKFDDKKSFRSHSRSSRGLPRGLESLNKSKYLPSKIKGRSRFRALVWAILFPVFAFNAINKRKGQLKRDYLGETTSSIKHFTKVAAIWVLNYTKEPILSILQDPSLDFDVTGKDHWYSKGAPKAINTKMLKIQIRLKGFISGLIEGTTHKNLSQPLIFFLEKFINNGSFVPDQYLVPYERARLNFDKFGALTKQDDEKKGMMLAFFFITRILISMYLLRPEENKLYFNNGGRVLM